MPLSYNAETGEAFTLDADGAWVKTKVAKVPETGDLFALDGAEWKALPKPARPAPSGPSGVLGSINNIVGGAADAVTQAVTGNLADEAGAGVRAGVRGVTNLIQGKDADFGGTYDRALADIRGREKQFATDHPVVATTAGVVGGLATGLPVARAASGAASLPRTIAKSAATGAGYGALAGFGAGEGGFENRLNEAVAGGALGAGLGAAVPLAGSLLTRGVSPVRIRLTPEQQRLAQVAETEGIPLTAAQATGSRPLQATESAFGTLPMTAGPQEAVSQAQRTAFNAAALRHIGESGTDLTPAVLNKARRRIGGDFNRLAAQTTVDLDVPFVTKVTDVVNEYNELLEPQKKPIFEKYVKAILAVGTDMKGTVYQKLRSDLGRMSKNYGGTDPTLSQALAGLRDALDAAADRSMPQHLKGDWDKARLQYGNLRTLEKAMSNTTTQAAAGNLSPTQLAQAVKQQYPRGYGFGYGPMNDLSRVGDTFIRDQVPNSGTAERQFLINLMTGGAGGSALLAGANPTAVAAAGATALLGPRLLQAAYNAGPTQRWLKNQVAAGAAPALNQGLLTAVLSGLAGGQ